MSLNPSDLPALLGDVIELLESFEEPDVDSVAADGATLSQVRVCCKLLHSLHQLSSERIVLERSASGKPAVVVDGQRGASQGWDPALWHR